MEVTRVENMDTHFVHGTSETIAMGMTADSSLLHVLSDALYSDKEFAVCREYIANGWDAHSMNGNSNPIQVTINYDEEEVIFRDYGPGIAHEDMGPIFGTYGASTKRDDKNQIGGFGLGSKAGYSVSETFTVTSHHGGVKTIYVASKGSEETKGFYDLQVVTRMPTDETGMEIRISVDHPSRFGKITKKLAEFGHKPILLEKVRYNVSEYDLYEPLAPEISDTGMLFAFAAIPYTTTNTRVFIRLGGICYPLSPKEEYQDTFSKLETMATKSRSCLIIEAPAGEIPLSPSREALSYSPKCIQTIKALLEDKSTHIPNQRQHVAMVCNRAARRAFGALMVQDPTFMSYLEDPDYLYEVVNDAFSKERTDYLNSVIGQDYINQLKQDDPVIFTDLFKLTSYLAFLSISSSDIRDIGQIVKKRILKQSRLGNKALFEFVYDSGKNGYHYVEEASLYNIIYKTYSKVFGKDVLKNIRYVDRYTNKTSAPLNSVRYIPSNDFLHRIILYYRQSDLVSFANKYKNASKFPSLAYRLTKKDDVHGITNYLKAQGFAVVDMVTGEDYKNPPKTQAQIDAHGRPKTSGYQLLSASLTASGCVDPDKIAMLNQEKTDQPDLVLIRETSNKVARAACIPNYRNIHPLLKYYPNAVIVSSRTTAENIKKKTGANTIIAEMYKFVCSIVKQLPLFYRERHKLANWRIHNEYANSSLGRICGIMPIKKPKLKLGELHDKFDDFTKLDVMPNYLLRYKGLKYLHDIDSKVRKSILANYKTYTILDGLVEKIDKRFLDLFEDSAGKSDLHAAIKKLYEESIQ